MPVAVEVVCAHGSADGAGMAGVLVVEDHASLAAARTAPSAAGTPATTTTQPGSAWGWVALGALLLSGAAMCVTLAMLKPRRPASTI